MKNILIVLPNDSLFGAEYVLKMIARNYKEHNVEVYFLKCKETAGWDDISDQVKLNYQDTNSVYLGLFLFIWSFLFKPIKEYDYIFTSQVLVTGIIGFLVRCGLVKKKYFVGRESTQIFDRFSGPKLFLYKKMYQFGYSSVDLLICQTEQMKQSLIANLPWIDKKIKVKVIDNPIDLSNLDDVEDMDNEQPFIVGAGRLIPEKGFDILIDAFKKIIEVYPDYQLIVLGEGKERANLENKIKSLQLENKVLLIGHVSNVYPYFKKAKLCVVSSRIEGFPNVLLQMISQNNKVVSTKCAGGIEKIPKINVVETHNSEILSEAILKSLSQDSPENRDVFNSFLEERSVANFIKKIENEFD